MDDTIRFVAYASQLSLVSSLSVSLFFCGPEISFLFLFVFATIAILLTISYLKIHLFGEWISRGSGKKRVCNFYMFRKYGFMMEWKERKKK